MPKYGTVSQVVLQLVVASAGLITLVLPICLQSTLLAPL